MKRITALLLALIFAMLVFPVGAGTGEDGEALPPEADMEAARGEETPEKEPYVIYSEPFSLKDITLQPALPLTAEGEDYAVRLYPGEKEALPADAVLSAQEIQDGSYRALAAAQLGIEEKEIAFLRVFDLSILSGDQVIEPEGPVRVEMDLAVAGEQVAALHFMAAPVAQTATKGRRTLMQAAPQRAETLETEVEGRTVQFSTDSFSAFAIVGYTLEKRVLASDGNTYLITVTYGSDAGLPEDADLDVKEIVQTAEAGGPTDYERYLEQTERALGVESGSIPYARFFDIHIVDADGNAVQIAEGATVQVSVRLEDVEEITDPRVVHFGEQTEILDSQAESNTVSFSAAGFSVYAVVDAPEPGTAEIQLVESVSELVENVGFYLSYGGTPAINIYFTNSLNNGGCFIEANSASSAATWYFEQSGSNYLIYTFVDGAKKYVTNASGNTVGLADDGGTPIEITPADGADGKFYFKHASQNKWLQHSNNGGGIRFWTDKNNAANSQIAITYASSYELPKDPYGLDGKTYGIVYNDNSAKAVGLKAEGKTVSSAQRLAAQDMLIRPDVLDHDGTLLVAQDADIPFWTFHNDHEDKYKISTTVDEREMYLVINGGNVTLTDDPQEASLITATPGTGTNSGKWHFTSEGYTLNYTGAVNNGYNAAAGTGATTWLNLVERSVLTDEDFHLYTAKKVSISDRANVYDTQQVVIYTRIWNDTTKQYEFYAVDHDGTLVRCYDTGDGIQWIGTRVNTALWDFTEYFDNNSPSYFYELQNDQYGQYIAPQVTGGQILAGSPIGINLNGRRYQENYSTIIAWDDANYAYVGLKAEDGHVVACPLSEAEDFYFAVVSPIDPDDTLSEVDTINNDAYGITMKMIDFNNENMGTGADPRDAVQHAFFGAHSNKYEPGLLSTDLTDGYPTTTLLTGHEKSLSELYDNMTDVNHLFIQSIHNESGYFEYNSTQNFAHLNENGNFTVYDQIGQVGANTYNDAGDFGATRTHGQFMPYNDLVAGRYSTATNQTDVLAQELPDVEPRKGEKLYLIPKNEADYFFGMELSASFTQTPSGLDAWGHDIIFEFSGDDDFWLYVDGELVLDLGGVRSAMTGKVNFRTGQVVNGGNITLKTATGTKTTNTYTLREVFESNYRTRNPGASAADVAEYLARFFDEGSTVFKDYTNHDMKIFYMERGAGASNLYMRFNLAAVKPGTFILSKKLSGTEQADNSLIEIPYQIYYKMKADGEAAYHLLTNKIGNDMDSVVYEGSSRPVTYLPSFTPAGGTEAYEDVFFLKPGESAEVTLPEGATKYYVVECGVNPDIYDRVTANGEELVGTPTGNSISDTTRLDYAIEEDTLDHRTEVEFDNHVQEGAMRTLSITKRLFDTDGKTRLNYPKDDTVFNFRLYLGSENADASQLPSASLYDYCVKDAAGNYCRWDADSQRFVSLVKTQYSALTDEEKEAATFTTSMYGSISKIPADHTVEVRNLILGTQYMVEERNYEVPRGYTLRSNDGYTRVDVVPEFQNGLIPYQGTILKNEDPEIEVRNQKGWGLTVQKVWTDSDFMSDHDDVYFAVYVRTHSSGELELYENSVRRLRHPETELYLFFLDLNFNDETYDFSDFVIREVTLTGDYITENEAGVITGYEMVTPVEEGQTVSVGGTPVGKPHQFFDYQVHYDVGASTEHNENIRTDTVTNSRPGIKLYKTDLDGGHLSGAVFTLTDEEGRNVALPTYTSGSDGLITIAYLARGDYTLTETKAPKGYVVLDQPLVLHVDVSGNVTVTPASDLYTVTNDPDGEHTAVITIRNRTTGLVAVKKNAATGEPLEGVHFALYRQVTQTDGTVRKDYQPIPGYEDLVTNENGVIPQVTEELAPGTYYLTETEAAAGFLLPEDDLCFTIGSDGTVRMVNHGGWLQRVDVSGSVSYVITIPNGEMPEPVDVVVSGVKILTGRDMEAGEFTFTMTPIDVDGQAIGPAVSTINAAGNAGDPTEFSFPALIYDMAAYTGAEYQDNEGNKLFYYVVEELIPGDAFGDTKDGVRYDTAKFLVVVKLRYSDKMLTATSKYYPYAGGPVPEDLQPAVEEDLLLQANQEGKKAAMR